MKKLFGISTIVALAAIMAFNVSIQSNVKHLSDLSLANIAALAKDENTDTEYTRVTDDCTITVTGKKNSTVTIAGIGTVTLDSNGEYKYVKEKGEVRCIGGGNEVCNAQNC